MTDLHRALLDAIRKDFETSANRDTDAARQIGIVLAATRGVERGENLSLAANQAASRHLDQAVAEALEGPAARIAAALAPVGHSLPWVYSYPDPDPYLAANVAFAELVGPRGPFRSSALRLGFTLISPNVTYPPHQHPATETYQLLAGTSLWEAGDVLRQLVIRAVASITPATSPMPCEPRHRRFLRSTRGVATS